MDDAPVIYPAPAEIWRSPVPAADGADPYVPRVHAMGRGLLYMCGGRGYWTKDRFIYRPRKNNG